jgi:hypothetical protein
MAFQEVKVDDAGELGSFFKFNAIGDKLLGVFVSYEEAQGTYGPEKRYTLKNREGLHTVTANFDLNRRLQAAQLQPGHAVKITHTGVLPNKDPSKSGMKQFKVEVDRDFKMPGAPPPPPVANDDIPF